MNTRNQSTAATTVCILDTLASAQESKGVFKEDYYMYEGYCGQYSTGTRDGTRFSVNIIPVTRRVYESIGVST